MHKTLIVVDSDSFTRPDVISFEKYLREYPKLNEPKTRIINLCDTEHYLSKGYYCSLLAEARCHSVLPSVKTINSLRSLNQDNDALSALTHLVEKLPDPNSINQALIFFGKTETPEINAIASKIFTQFPSPILQVNIRKVESGWSLRIERRSFSQLSEEDKNRFLNHLDDFTHTVWRIQKNKKTTRWDMAILVNPQEKVPPSNKDAINKFVKAAAKFGIQADVISADQLTNIGHYDALFIRETTAIDHHTYRLSKKAEDLGLIVLDDSSSILRCCNKVYLHDAFSYKDVPSLKTEVVDNNNDMTLDKIESQFDYPLVLKMPEGSFSNGVFKVNNREELSDKLNHMLSSTALVLVQEYLYTEFDWRIGVLDGRAIYACKYVMARNHWQIYNHSAKRFFSGDFETMPTFEVPKPVLQAAVKAANIVGRGLYGVDVKEADHRAYVLEVNDNPSIDHKVEDAYLGDELYMQIMSEFYHRLEKRGR